MKVSFIVPTCRNYEEYAKKTVDSIYSSSFDFEFEVLVCSKQTINDSRIKWIQEPESNIGSVKPINILYQASVGEYVSLLNDDFDIDSSFTNVLYQLEKEDGVKISGLYPDRWIAENDLKLIPDTSGGVFPAQMLCFPVVRKEDAVKILGENLLDARFIHHWSDVYLTLFLYRKFGAAKLCKESVITMREASSNSYNSHGRDIYMKLVGDGANINYE